MARSRWPAWSTTLARCLRFTRAAGPHPVRVGPVTEWPISDPLGVGDILIGQAQRLTQRIQLPVGEIAEGAAWDRAKLERTDPRADQFQHRVANLIEHLADNPVAPLVNDDPDDRAVLGVADRPDHLRRRALAVDRDAAPEPIEHLRRRIAVQQSFVLLVDPIAWVHDAVRHLAIVRQQQETLGLPVEPANRHDAFIDRHEIHDRVAAALVGCRGDIATGLVEEDVAPPDVRDQLAIDLDLLGGGIDLAAKLSDDLTVNTHAAADDQLLGAPA